MQHVCHMLLQLYTCDMCKQCGHVQSCQISADMCSQVKLNGRPTTPFGVLASVFLDRHSVKGPGVAA